MRYLKITAKVLAWIIGVLLLLLLILVLAIQLPSVQNRILGYAIPTIEQTLGGAEVDIEHVNINFFDVANVEGIYVEDLAGDTLLYANELSVDIGVFSLLGKEIFIDEISLDGAVVNAYQLRGDSAFNYQFILDAFAPADTAQVDTSQSAFTFGLQTVDLTNTRVRLLDEVAGSDLNASLRQFKVDIGTLDLEDFAVGIDDVLIDGLDGSYQLLRRDSTGTAVLAVASDTSAAGQAATVFPYAGLPITVDDLELSDINFAYRNQNSPEVASGIDPGNIAIADLEAKAQDFVWDSTRLALDWRSLTFRERSGVALDELAFGLNVTDQALTLRGLNIATPASRISVDAELAYPDFASLTAADPATEVDLTFDDTEVAFADVKLLAPTLADAGLNLDATGPLRLDGRVHGTLAVLTLEEIAVRLGERTELQVAGVLNNPTDPDRLSYDLQLGKLTSSYAELNRYTEGLGLPPELAGFGAFDLSGALSGTTNDFRGRNLALRTSGRTGFRGDISAQNLSDPNSLYIDAVVKSLTTNTEELAGFIPDSLGVDAQALGDVDFSGTYQGTLTDFALEGELATDIGSSTQDIAAKFNEDYTDGSYAGTIAIDSFDVGALLQDSTIGTLTMKLDVDGEGLSPEAIASQLDTRIESFTYQDYTYHDVYVNGKVAEQRFNGQARMDDPNVKFQFKGLLDFSDTIPAVDFVANVDTLALQPLGFYPTPLGVKLGVTSKLRGNNADNLVGGFRIDSLYLQDSANYVLLDSLLLRAGDTTNGRFLAVNSPILTASIIGKYYTADLAPLLTNYVNDFFPINDYVSPKDTPNELAIEPTDKPVLTDQKFAYSLELHDPVEFVNMFDPNLKRLDTASLVGTFDTREKELLGRFFLPNLDYGGNRIDTILLDIGGDASEMLLKLRTGGINAGGQKIHLALVNLGLGDDSLRMDLEAYVVEDSLLLGTGIRVTQNEKQRYEIRMNRDLEIAGQTWKVDRNNYIEYFANYLYIRDLVFRKDEQSIAVRSTDESGDVDIAPLTVRIDNFDLNEVAQLIQTEDFSLTGRVNGDLEVRDPNNDMYYAADMSIDEIVLNEQEVGKLTLKADTKTSTEILNVDVGLHGPLNDVNVGGTYGIKDGALAINADIEKVELRLIDPLATGILSNSSGIFKANMKIGGTVEQPSVVGYAGFDEARTTYDLLGIDLGIADSRIDFSESQLDFGKFVVTDSAGREATLSGKITHDYFTNFNFDLQLRTDEFRVLNTDAAVDALYYGQAVVGAKVDITGNIDDPKVRVVAETKDGTEVYVQPLISTNGVSEEDWVIYADPTRLPQDTSQSLDDVYQANALGLDLGLQLKLSDDATAHVIIDPITGDELEVRGNSDMLLQMNPNGSMLLSGAYTITEGTYQLTVGASGLNLKKLLFDIEEGSVIQFVGDPLDSRFNIRAISTVQTTTFPLIEAEVNDPNSSEALAAKKRQPVNVIMGIKGDIAAPEIGLSIELPNENGTVSSGIVERKLAQLRQNQTELYAQAVSLLVLGGFKIQGASSGGNKPSGAVADAAIGSLSNIVSDQLNRLADDIIKGVDINVGVESYENDYAENRTTKGNIDVSKSLMDDRLILTIGSELDVQSGTNSAAGGANTSAIQTSFVLSYLLDEPGHYKLRVFRQPANDALSSSNSYKVGTGVSFQKKFD